MAKDLIKRLWVARARRKFGNLPIADVFTEVYTRGWWGRHEGEFCSGSGSSAKYTSEYCTWIASFIQQHGIRNIVDLGCGDFRVGHTITSAARINYTGVDVVANLVRYNNRHYSDSRTRFVQLDIIQSALPDADLCLIRQVLQHLSNTEIHAVMKGCSKYRFVLVTEHVYTGGDCIPNVDKPHGPDIRVADRSGVFLEASPFNIPCCEVVRTGCGKDEVMRSTLIET